MCITWVREDRKNYMFMGDSSLKKLLKSHGMKGSKNAINLFVARTRSTAIPGDSSKRPYIMPPTAWTVVHRLAHSIVNEKRTLRTFYEGAIFGLLHDVYGFGDVGMRTGPSRSLAPAMLRSRDLWGSVANQLFDFRSARTKNVIKNELLFEVIAHIIVTAYKPRMLLPETLETPSHTYEMQIPESKAKKKRDRILENMVVVTERALKDLRGRYIDE